MQITETKIEIVRAAASLYFIRSSGKTHHCLLSVVNMLLAVPVVSHQQLCLRLRLSDLSDGWTFLSQWGGDAGISRQMR